MLSLDKSGSITETPCSGQRNDVARNEKFGSLAAILINRMGIDSMLDYGCGLDGIANYLEVDHAVSVSLYDPAILKYSDPPLPKPFVVCINMLKADMSVKDAIQCLDDLFVVTTAYGLFAVPDVVDSRWWIYELCTRFDVSTLSNEDGELWCLVRSYGDN